MAAPSSRSHAAHTSAPATRLLSADPGVPGDGPLCHERRPCRRRPARGGRARARATDQRPSGGEHAARKTGLVLRLPDGQHTLDRSTRERDLVVTHLRSARRQPRLRLLVQAIVTMARRRDDLGCGDRRSPVVDVEILAVVRVRDVREDRVDRRQALVVECGDPIQRCVVLEGPLAPGAHDRESGARPRPVGGGERSLARRHEALTRTR